MSEKVCFLISVVLVLTFSGAAAADEFDDPSYNFSFEWDPCGDQILGHRDDMTRHAMAWRHNQDFAGMDVYCPYATASPTHCHDFPATDGIVYAFIQHNDCNVYQAFDPNYDPNGALLAGRMYTLTFDSLTESPGGATITAAFYYLNDVCEPDVNHTTILAKGYALPAQSGWEDMWDWSTDLTLRLVCEDPGASNGKPLGISFRAPPSGSYSFVDNVRLEWQYATSAYEPSPADEEEKVALDANLSWLPGLWVDEHRVYFGTDLDAVTNRLEDVNQGLVDTNSFDPGALALGKIYYWAVDEVNDGYVGTEPPPGPWPGPVWSFSSIGFASAPSPADGARGVALNVVLSWTAGAEADQHDVYFGTSYSAVEDATTSSGEYREPRLDLGNESYDAGVKESLMLGDSYYWRVDEINNIVVKGRVWKFTIGDYAVLDDFDSYTNNPELTAVWDDGYVNTSGSWITVEMDVNIVRDGNSLMFEYNNDDKKLGSRIDADIADLPLLPDWTTCGGKAVVLWFRGKSGNSATADDKMWVELEDTSSNAGVAIYDGDLNNVKVAAWHEWNIDLGIFDACGVSLTNVDKVHMGLGGPQGGQTSKSGTGTVWFDDIRLYPARCRPEVVATDFTGDCTTDLEDLGVMGADWLLGDFNTLGNTGYLKGYVDNDTQWVVAGKIDGALKFDKSLKNYVDFPDANWSGATHMSFSAWVWPDGCQPDYCGIVYSREFGRGDASGLGYGKGTTTEPDDLNYNWNNKTWGWNSGLDVPRKQWSFVAAVVTPDLGRAFLSDGVSMTTADNDVSHAPLIQFNWGCDNRIGSDAFHGMFNGLMDDIRVYDYNLSGTDVNNLALQGPDPNPGPILWYKFDESAGLIAADSGYSTDPVYRPVPSIANLIDTEPEYERYVNFRDFDIMAEDWLKEQLWPAP